MSRPKTAVLANRLWVAKRLVKPQHLHPFRYTIRERVWDDMFGAFVIMDREVCAYREYATKVGFHCGDLEKLQATFRGFTFYDERAAPRLPLRGRQLKVRLKLRAEQRGAVRAWLKRGYGIIFAPVRWGKTIAAAAAAFKLGLRTIMMVDKLSLAQQWLDELRKSKHTNLRKIERRLGRPLAGVIAGSIKPGALRKLKHFPPLTFTTFQSIHSLLKRRPKFMRRHRNAFGLVIVDEVHHSPAITYAHAIAFFNAAHRLGVTGSIKRRDGKHMVMHDIMGPVTGIGTQEQMPVTVYLHFTDVNVRAQTSWTTMISNLCRSLPLTDAVLEQVITDAEQGRYVMVHSERNQHLEDMCARVRRLAPHLNPQFIHQKVKVPVRKKYVRQMERGKIKVLFVGNVFMEGMTIKRADCLHLFPTTTNPEAVKQRTGRVRTFVAGKPRPLVRLWCVGGHGGLFAGRAVHFKYFKEHPHDFRVRTATLAEVVGNTATRKLQRRERRAARTCSQCRRFIRCRTAQHIRAQGSVCSRFKKHPVPAQLKLQWLVHYRHRLNEYGQRMIGSFRRQSAKRLSVDQLRILNEVYMDLLNNPQTAKLPSL